MKQYGLYFAWIIAVIATAGSIAMGELTNEEACVLCWYQRMFMYPLVIILGIAAFRQALGIILYTLPLSIIGFLFALYQVITIQFFPSLCIVCKISELPRHPYLFPLLSCIAFALISIFLTWTAIANRFSK